MGLRSQLRLLQLPANFSFCNLSKDSTVNLCCPFLFWKTWQFLSSVEKICKQTFQCPCIVSLRLLQLPVNFSFCDSTANLVCNWRDTIAVSRLAPNKEAMPIANAGHCCNSRIFHAASTRCFPYTTACQLTQPIVGYTARDTVLNFGPPSGTGKLIPLLLDAGTSSCTRFPLPTDWIFPQLAHGHRCFTIQVWPMS